MSRQGVFITFEGGEGAGKTTLIDTLSSYLEDLGISFVKTRAPGGTEIGQQIRHLLLHSDHAKLDARAELLLFLADRAQHVQEVILPALQEGKVVLCDRFNDSTIAYQGVARGLSQEVVAKQCAFACFDLQPDLTFYLDLDPKVGFSRTAARSKDRIESEQHTFHENIRAAFQMLAKQAPQRIVTLDASGEQRQVFSHAKEKLDAFFLTHR